MRFTTCPWCRSTVLRAEHHCPKCGHDLHVPPERCRCATCQLEEIRFRNPAVVLPEPVSQHQPH